MSAVYLALMGVASTVWVFLVGGMAAVAQIVATQVSPAVAPLTWRRRRFLVAGILLVLVTCWCVVAGVFGAADSHDRALDDPRLAVASVAMLVVVAGFLAAGVLSGIGLIVPSEAMHALLGRVRPEQWASFVVGSRAKPQLSSEDEGEAAEGLELDPATIFLGAAVLLSEEPSEEASEAETGTATVEVENADDSVWTTFKERLLTRRDERAHMVKELQTASATGHLADPLTAAFEVVSETLAKGSDLTYRRLIDRLIEGTLECHSRATSKIVLETELRRLSLGCLFEDHIIPLAMRCVDVGRPERAAVISRAIAARFRSDPSPEAHEMAFRTAFMLGREFVERRAAAPLCSVITDLGDEAIQAVMNVPEPLAENRFNEALRGIASIGQRIPSAFYFRGEPLITMGPDASSVTPSVPLGALFDALEHIEEELFEKGNSTASTLIWADAVKVTAREVNRHSVDVLQSNRLEPYLFAAVELLAKTGIRAARVGQERPAVVAAMSLGDLAADANHAIYHEYPTFVAIQLAEIAVHALDHDINWGTRSQNLGEWIVERLERDLPESIPYVKEQAEAGRFDAASYRANERFIAML